MFYTFEMKVTLALEVICLDLCSLSLVPHIRIGSHTAVCKMKGQIIVNQVEISERLCRVDTGARRLGFYSQFYAGCGAGKFLLAFNSFFNLIFILYSIIVDLQCCVSSFRPTTKRFSYTYTDIHSFSDSFLI